MGELKEEEEFLESLDSRIILEAEGFMGETEEDFQQVEGFMEEAEEDFQGPELQEEDSQDIRIHGTSRRSSMTR